MKKLFRTNMFIRIIAKLLSTYIKLIKLTCKIEFDGRDIFLNNIKKDQAIIFCFWHSRLLLGTFLPFGQYKDTVSTIISEHGDGEIIAQVIKNFGFKSIRGSSNKNGRDKGGTKVLIKAIQQLKANKSIAITPDGPRGPREKMNESIFLMRNKSNAVIIPLYYDASRKYTFNSWDKFIIPKFFSTITIKCHQPYYGSDIGEVEKMLSKGK